MRVPATVLEQEVAGADNDGLVDVNLLIRSGVVRRIEMYEPSGVTQVGDVDGGARIVFPQFVDLHTHLDKAHIVPRTLNPDGTFQGALAGCKEDRERNWTLADLIRRMDFAVRSAIAHGTRAMRTHLDVTCPEAPADEAGWQAFLEIRARWRHQIELQAVSLSSLVHLDDTRAYERYASFVAEHGGALGMVVRPDIDLPDRLLALFNTAGRLGVDIDLHVDEMLDPEATSLLDIADAIERSGFAGTVTAGHCCSLSSQHDDLIEKTLDRVAAVGIAVVSLPLCNLYLQDRVGGRTPRARGVTVVQEMAARGINVAFASDNTRDPFYAYGDQDMLEVLREATRIAHLDHPIGRWPAAVTRVAGDIMGRPEFGCIRTGDRADLILFNARTYSELYSRPQSDRMVLSKGRPSTVPLPDYRELD